MYLEQKQDVIKESEGNMVKFAAAGYVCVDYYPDFNNRYYITGNGVDVLFNLLDIKKEKIWKHPLFPLYLMMNTEKKR